MLRSCTNTHIHCHWSTDLSDVTCKPSTHSKKQDIGLKTKHSQHCRYIICANCTANAWFLNQDLFFFEWLLSLQVSGVDWRFSTITHHHYHWSIDNTVVRVHWWVRRILRIAHRYLLDSLIFSQRFLTQRTNSAVFVELFISQKWVFLPTCVRATESSELLAPVMKSGIRHYLWQKACINISKHILKF